VLVALLVGGCSHRHAPTAPEPGQPPGVVSYAIHQGEPAWSSSGLIAYHDYGVTTIFRVGAWVEDASLAGLWILDPATGSRQRIAPFGESPAWSPDSSTLAFESGGQIYRVSADGSDLRQLTTTGMNFHPCWNPSGDQITFDRYPMSGSDGAQAAHIEGEGGGASPPCEEGGQGSDCESTEAGGEGVTCQQGPPSSDRREYDSRALRMEMVA
jgi:hypothetical protein